MGKLDNKLLQKKKKKKTIWDWLKWFLHWEVEDIIKLIN